MATPLAALGRIIIEYRAAGTWTHKYHAYVRNPQLVGATWMINSRATDSNDLDWSIAADHLMETISYILPASSTFGTAVLETRSGGVYTPRAVFTMAATNHCAGTMATATQLTVTLRDTLFKKLKVIILDGTEPAPGHSNSPTAGSTALDNFIAQYLSTNSVAAAPYTWQVSRANQYINTSPFVMYTIALNAKIRRMHGFL